jgi:hypothetical protein
MQRADHLAPVQPEALYPLPVLMRFCGLTRKSWDAARRNGLVTHRAGKRVFVLGSDFIHWVHETRLLRLPRRE